MAINNFGFDSTDVTQANEGFKDTSVYTDPANETETRKQLQMPLSQIRKWLNDNVVANINNAISHIANTSNPHSVTKSQVGLGNVDNTADTDKPVSTATQTAITNAVNAHANRTDNPHSVTKSQVGLGNVDNTSDANKPISTATQTALDNKVDKVSGKQLSTEDFTSALKTKLDGITAEATKTLSYSNYSESDYDAYCISINGVRYKPRVPKPDWNETDSTKQSYIQNKPTVHSVSVSESGTSTDEVNYITIDGEEKKLGGGGSGGTTNYAELTNKPQINGVELLGNKSADDFSIFKGYWFNYANTVTYSDFKTIVNKGIPIFMTMSNAWAYRWFKTPLKFVNGVDDTANSRYTATFVALTYYVSESKFQMAKINVVFTASGCSLGAETISNAQEELVSGTNIKSINGNSILASGDLLLQEQLVSGTNIKSINGNSLLGSGNISIQANPSVYNITVSGTPTAMSEYKSWDTNELYLYSLAITVSGLTANSCIVGLTGDDTIMSEIAPHMETGANTLTLFATSATALTGSITIRTLEVA